MDKPSFFAIINYQWQLMRLISIPERSRSALKGISTTFQDHKRVLYRIVSRRVIDY